MTNEMKRSETLQVDEKQLISTASLQWLLEKKHMAGTHPICNNSRLTMLICGKDGFADIAAEIGRAQKTIDICCWGYDAAMELVREGHADTWPRGPTYGDLLIAAGKRGVAVRLLIWHDGIAVVGKNPRNIPGVTHDRI
ncbi:MAG: phospholipase, partial [Massilia sp.]